MSRKGWIGTLLAMALIGLLVAAWRDGGREPMRWIEQPVRAAGEGG